jgi:hypothetical protein
VAAEGKGDSRRRYGCGSEGSTFGRHVALECGGRGRATQCAPGDSAFEAAGDAGVREVAASAKAVSALAPRSATALQKGAAAGRERWGERWRFVLISNGRVRRGDLSRRAAPAEAGFRRLKPPPRGWQRWLAGNGVFGGGGANDAGQRPAHPAQAGQRPAFPAGGGGGRAMGRIGGRLRGCGGVFLISNGRVRRGDLSRRAAPAMAWLSAAKAAAP